MSTADKKGGVNDRNSSNQMKRKRFRQSPEEQHQLELADRYNKLVHACSKLLHKDAKIVKSFECQKIVRSIKSAKESVGEGAGQDDKTSTRLATLEKKLERTKKLDLEALVQVGLKRLGVLCLDPRGDEEFTQVLAKSNDKAAESKRRKNSMPQKLDAQALSQCDDPFFQSLSESMLQHKRLSACLDQLNDKVTEFREWKVSRELILRGESDPSDAAYEGKKRKKKKKEPGNSASENLTIVVAGGFRGRQRGLDLGGHEGASGLFIGSLAGMPAEEYNDGGEGGSDDDGDDYDVNANREQKKNRPGQRARRAKASALEARKSGKAWNSSINWREKKQGRNEMEKKDGGHDRKTRGDESAKPKEAQHIATMGKTWKEEGNAHPSWAAKAAQKSQGIAKFEGTKITFD
ncbi:hypothetical protein ACHAXH_000081 [Discostella pseudostelligera]